MIMEICWFLHTFFKIGAGWTTHLFDPNRKQRFFTDIYYLCETEQEFVIIQEFSGAILFNDC
jgi:hypothetical protein